MNKFRFSPNKQGALMTRVTHRVTQLQHQHTKPRWRQGDLITPVVSIINTFTSDPPTSFPPPYYHRMARWNVCMPPLIKNKQNQIGVLWGKQSSLTIPACKHAKTPDTNSARGLIYCRPLIKCVWWVHLARNRYETLPSCKGEPPRQFLGRIPPHTHLQVCPSYVKPPT